MNCNKCRGRGRVPNPDYPTKAAKLDRGLENGSLPYPHYKREMLGIFGSWDRIPSEDINCPNCQGRGRV